MTDVLIIVVLLLLSAFFSASETAFSSVNRIRLRNYVSQGDKRAVKALKIIEFYDKSLTTILVGNNIVNIASTSIATIFFTREFGSGSVGLATIVMTVLVLTFGEILPKSLAKENAEKVALAVAQVLCAFIFILTPITTIFIKLKKLITKINGNINTQPSVTEEELKYIIEEIEDEGVLEEQESNLVRSALEFDEITISEILIPRVNVVAIEKSQSIEEIKDIFINERYSRLPVYDKTIDNIIGIIHEKDFFRLYIRGGNNIPSIIQEPKYISEHKRISEIMHEMQRSKAHMAIVVDQYGGTEGIVTLEDIIEELVGEIYDENDEEYTSFTKINENKYEASGELSINDMLEELDLPEDTIQTECNSIGGWIMKLLEHIPEENETVSCGSFTLTVLKIDDQKIEKVLIDISDHLSN